MQRKYTEEDVKHYREAYSCSVHTAKDYFEREYFLECVHIAHRNRDFDLLCEVVRELVTKVRFA